MYAQVGVGRGLGLSGGVWLFHTCFHVFCTVGGCAWCLLSSVVSLSDRDCTMLTVVCTKLVPIQIYVRTDTLPHARNYPWRKNPVSQGPGRAVTTGAVSRAVLGPYWGRASRSYSGAGPYWGRLSSLSGRLSRGPSLGPGRLSRIKTQGPSLSHTRQTYSHIPFTPGRLHTPRFRYTETSKISGLRPLSPVGSS